MAPSMWSLLHNPSAHSSAWMLTSASCFWGRFALDLQTRRVNRSAISSKAFAVFPLEIHWIQSWTASPCLWNSKLRLPPLQDPPPPPSSVVWYGYFLESPNNGPLICVSLNLNGPFVSTYKLICFVLRSIERCVNMWPGIVKSLQHLCLLVPW